jgi:hypothetical protein
MRRAKRRLHARFLSRVMILLIVGAIRTDFRNKDILLEATQNCAYNTRLRMTNNRNNRGNHYASQTSKYANVGGHFGQERFDLL